MIASLIITCAAMMTTVTCLPGRKIVILRRSLDHGHLDDTLSLDYSNVEEEYPPLNQQVSWIPKPEWKTPLVIPVIKNIGLIYPKPVEIRIPQPVAEEVPQPYPVQMPVVKRVTIPVIKTVVIPVEKKVPFPIEKIIPVPMEKPVPFTVEKHIPFPVEKPYPVHVPVYKHVIHPKKNHYDWVD